MTPHAVRLTTADYRDVVKSALSEIRRDDVPSLAAGVAFKMFLSLFPSLIAGVALFSLAVRPSEIPQLLDTVGRVLPPSALELIRLPLENLVSSEPSLASGAVIFGVLGGTWAATSAALTLARALSRAYNVPDTRRFVALRLVALAITAALLVALVSIFVLLVAGGTIEDAVLDRLFGGGTPRSVIDALATAGRYLLAIAVIMILFAFVYWIGPDRDPRPAWEWISPGAVIGVVGWLALSLAFRVYVVNWGNYGEGSPYAGIGGVIVLLLWLQLSIMALLVGAEFNSELRRARRRRRDALDAAGFGADLPPHAGTPSQLDAAAPRRLASAGAVVQPTRAPPPSSAVTAAVAAGLVGLVGLMARRSRRSARADRTTRRASGRRTSA